MKRLITLIAIFLTSSSLLAQIPVTDTTKSDPNLARGGAHISIENTPKDQDPKSGIQDDKNHGKETSSFDEIKSSLSTLISYNFSGGNKNLSKLTPVVYYGWNKTKNFANKSGNFTFGIQPYVGGQIDTRDSSTYLPALMLPGLAGVKTDAYWTFHKKNKDNDVYLIVSPLNFGYKLVSNFADTSITLAQHNLRSSIAFGYSTLFLLSVQYTYGWHNSISQSEKDFTSVFGRKATDIQYLNITLQTQVGKLDENVPTYLFLEWRGLLNNKSYESFGNNKIISVGIRSDIGFKNSTPAKIANN